jgi:hypothetical protein
MSRADKAALAKGAEAIRKADAKGKLDGTLGAVAKEIRRLHDEILSAAKTSLEKAIRVGELLSRVRASRKGRWLLLDREERAFHTANGVQLHTLF